MVIANINQKEAINNELPY